VDNIDSPSPRKRLKNISLLKNFGQSNLDATLYGGIIELMNKIDIFNKYSDEYDEWFNVNSWVYHSEVQAVTMLLPQNDEGIEIGVGTGRFSIPFGITVGVEPSRAMAEIARSRRMTIYDAKAENLPFDDNAFDFALMVTTICFLEDSLQAIR
jgi:ubiquinone/menaquinone biosynthesis C-methylase UbiE